MKAELNNLTLKIEQIERSISRVPDKDPNHYLKKRRLIKDIANLEFEIKEITETLEQYQNDEKILNLKYKQAFDKEVDNLQAESVQQNIYKELNL